MKRSTTILSLVAALLAIGPARADTELHSPGFPPSRVADDGSIVEPWGAVRLLLAGSDGGMTAPPAEKPPMPMAATCCHAGPIVMSQAAYRAPIWPAGVDVLEAALTNNSDEPAKAELELMVPEAMQVGETTGSIEGRPSLTLPAGLQPIREEREWGSTGGVSALPGWAKSNVPCDPAFRNIAAGMGGVPITYRFAVEPGSKRTVALGFCESHHPTAGLRPMVVQVEGAEDRTVDPIAAWGRHGPGVLQFEAADANADGRLQVTVAPHPQARDRNPILNVLWIFNPTASLDAKRLLAGEMNEQAQRYVDVGGENDQLLYKPGNLHYSLQLGPKERKEFFLLLRSPGCPYLPDLSQGLWDPATLRKAAADVWRDRWEEPAPQE